VNHPDRIIGLQVRALPGASKSQSRFAGNQAVSKQDFKNRCYRFVIGFFNFTRLSDGTCADNGEHFCLSPEYKLKMPLGMSAATINDPRTRKILSHVSSRDDS
jgi:hypothetical protein